VKTTEKNKNAAALRLQRFDVVGVRRFELRASWSRKSEPRDEGKHRSASENAKPLRRFGLRERQAK
jgi:hypothetical protein